MFFYRFAGTEGHLIVDAILVPVDKMRKISVRSCNDRQMPDELKRALAPPRQICFPDRRGLQPVAGEWYAGDETTYWVLSSGNVAVVTLTGPMPDGVDRSDYVLIGPVQTRNGRIKGLWYFEIPSRKYETVLGEGVKTCFLIGANHADNDPLPAEPEPERIGGSATVAMRLEPIVIDYRSEINEQINAHGWDNDDPGIRKIVEEFPIEVKDEVVRRRPVLILKHGATIEEVVEVMRAGGIEPADAAGMIAFAARYPNLGKRGIIVAPGQLGKRALGGTSIIEMDHPGNLRPMNGPIRPNLKSQSASGQLYNRLFLGFEKC